MASEEEYTREPLVCGLQLRFTADICAALQQVSLKRGRPSLGHGHQFTLCTGKAATLRSKSSCKALQWPWDKNCRRAFHTDDCFLFFGFTAGSDLILESSTWNNNVVGELSKWIDLDAADAQLRHASEKALKQELMWASHLSLAAVVAPCPSKSCLNYANAIQRLTSKNPRINLWISVPLSVPAKGAGSTDDHDEAASPWHAWNKLRVLCNNTNSMGVLLELSSNLPSQADQDRWFAEPVKAVLIPTSIFTANAKGYPVLLAAHQKLLVRLHQYDVQFILSGRPKHMDGLAPYYLYLDHLAKRAPAPSMKDEFESPFYDCLQTPLQPLMDHLESQMYETFEKDPIKYEQYEKAVARALADTPVDKVSVVMVVGAGRGPLVRASLRAAASVQREIRMFAVEKNPNAVITLRNMKEMLAWGDTVTIVHTDMRYWEAPEQADILVSELLGSWGDNELSPECLDGAEKFLKPDGISIPCEYTSFVAPISTPRLWTDCRAFGDLKYMETMYVVKLHKFNEFDDPQPCFTFAHPSWRKARDVRTGREYFASEKTVLPALVDGEIDNARFRTLEFTARHSGMLHGFVGYFEAKLYKDVSISINPATFSEGMFSWFPIYIPIRVPQLVRRGETIRAAFWRHCNTSQVWYEWALDAPHPTPVHNVNGESAPIKLTSED
ncbi:Protein arginine N-methyltransferase 5 [Hondaea fermentalgiana]|uniref:Protein arginine N-methyltransferase n=1 Tax=Hondaea fermentalgiana TaxID=2315210 RepID=A0A2R5G724_9STRA|nr:Protein arginine N-methyltransferase 5 [Hondaea fermentalgiana]|eukprot:GBG23841.1 Protein arginine N-methyltransferase 5 [Hondaea fermentalgiana]